MGQQTSLLRMERPPNREWIKTEEIDKKQFETFFKRKLSKLGYKGVYLARSSGNRKRPKAEADKVDGCAIYFKADRLTLVETNELDCNAKIHDTSEWYFWKQVYHIFVSIFLIF